MLLFAEHVAWGFKYILLRTGLFQAEGKTQWLKNPGGFGEQQVVPLVWGGDDADQWVEVQLYRDTTKCQAVRTFPSRLRMVERFARKFLFSFCLS